jgi:hypothetical protein
MVFVHWFFYSFLFLVFYSFLFAEKSDSKFEWWVSRQMFEEKPKQDITDWVSLFVQSNDD